MNKNFLGGLAVGVGMMYLMDPQSGRRRRQVAREKAGEAMNRTGSAIRDASSNILEMGKEALGRGRQAMEQGGSELVERGRDAIGAKVSSASRMLEDATNGGSGGAGGLRGAVAHPAFRRSAIGATGGALAYYGIRKRGVVGTGLGLAGLGLLAYGVTNRSALRMFRKGDSAMLQAGSDFHVEAPPERVFEFWSKVDNFPRFLSHLKEVRDLGNGRSRWVASGPAGVPVEWEAMTTERVANERISWRSTPDSMIETEGTVRFQRSGTGTDVSVRMGYQLPGGELGQKFAALFRSDPQHAMDEDLGNLKQVIERELGAGSSQSGQGRAGASQPQGVLQGSRRESPGNSGIAGGTGPQSGAGGPTQGQRGPTGSQQGSRPGTGSQGTGGSGSQEPRR